jgi:AcrR family transcriptional regulator
VATIVATGHVETGAVLTTGKRQDDNHHDHDGGDDPKYLHPARGGGWFWVGGAWWISHVGVLPIRPPGSLQQFTRHLVSVKSGCPVTDVTYTLPVPKLWNETIEEHRSAVREAILDSTVSLVAEHGLLSVTMSQIAGETGIGRATLYKYFPDVEAILRAWHERQIDGHLGYLAEVRDRAGDAGERLAAVLEAYALISHESHGHRDTELAALLHRGGQVIVAEQHLRDMIRDLMAEGAKTGAIRNDVQPGELASYCIHALTAASNLPSKTAVRRLVTVTLSGLRPQK